MNDQNKQQPQPQPPAAPIATVATPRPVLFYRDGGTERGSWETYTPVEMAARADGSLDLVIMRYGTDREVFPAVRRYQAARDRHNRVGTFDYADGEE